MKKIRNLIAIVAAVMLMALSVFPAMAAGDQAAQEARSGVVKILVYYNNRKYPESMGSGFLINEDHILTAHHVVEDQPGEKVTKVSVVAVGDIEVEAKQVTASSARDFSILKLKTKINKKIALSLGTPSGFEATSTVYALGFPEVKEFTNDKATYASGDVTITSGTVSAISTMNTLKVIQHDAKLDFGNSGGPLIYSTGTSATVVGVNVASFENGSKYYFAVHIDEVIEALDTLGIPYTNSSGGVEITTQAQTQQGTTDATTTTNQPTTPAPADSEKKSNTPLIIGIVAGVAVLAIIIVIVLVMSKKKNAAPAPAPAPGGGFTPPAPPVAPVSNTMTGSGGAGSEGTTVLSGGGMGGDPNATTVLGASASSAYLVRTSNNERINITKPYFKIGKDANRVDFCVTGNPAVSRFHAAIVTKNGQYFIVDNSTTNHTYVNDSMIPANVETQITNGARIRLADEKFEFKI